jgi:hypothetical protein
MGIGHVAYLEVDDDDDDCVCVRIKVTVRPLCR